jgi:hypothetical protein
LNSSIQKPIDTLIVAMNQTTKTADDQQSTGAMESSDDNKNKDKKKNLPVCGK